MNDKTLALLPLFSQPHHTRLSHAPSLPPHPPRHLSSVVSHTLCATITHGVLNKGMQTFVALQLTHDKAIVVIHCPLPYLTHGVDGMHPCTYSFVLCADDMNISFPVHTHLSHTHSGFAHTHAIVVVKAWANRRKKHTQHSPVMQSCCFRHNTAPSTPLVNTLCGVLVIGMLCVHVSVGVCVPLACLACTTLCCVCLHTLISPCQHTN